MTPLVVVAECAPHDMSMYLVVTGDAAVHTPAPALVLVLAPPCLILWKLAKVLIALIALVVPALALTRLRGLYKLAALHRGRAGAVLIPTLLLASSKSGKVPLVPAGGLIHIRRS